MRRPVSIYRSLLASLLLVIGLLSGVILAMSYLQASRAVRRLSAKAIEDSMTQVDAQLRSLFEPVERTMRLMHDLAGKGRLEFDGMEPFVGCMSTVIQRVGSQLTSGVFARGPNRGSTASRSGGSGFRDSPRRAAQGNFKVCVRKRNC